MVHTITIQIASKGNFVSVEFGTQQIMEQFRSEPLSIKGFNVPFYPDKRNPKPEKRLMNVSLLNIPPETPKQIVTEFIESYADVERKPLYVQKTHNGITYCTGTRVYQINKLYQHIPRRLPNMFGRTIMCMYDLQPEQQEYYERKQKQRQQNNRTQQQQPIDDSDSSNIESDEETDNSWKQQRYYRKKQNQQKRKQNNRNLNNVTQRKNKQAPQTEQQSPKTNEQPQNQNTKTKTQTEEPPKTLTDANEPHITPETNSLPEPTVIPETYPILITQPDEFLESPSLATNNRKDLIQDTPDPNNISTPETTPTDKEDNNAKTTPKIKQQLKQEYKTLKAKKLTTQLQQTSFCDIGKLTNATKEERDKIIALSMYDRLGPYDPSNEYLKNYKHKDVIERYKAISMKRPTKNNTLLELYHIIQTIELRK